jgi:hypothetical protein
VNKRFIPLIVVAVALALWSLNEVADRQEWMQGSRAATLMNHARLKCDSIWHTDASGVRHPAWIDPQGQVFLVSGTGTEADNAALNECARANLGPGVPPIDWLKFFAVAVVALGLAAIPLIVPARRRMLPNSEIGGFCASCGALLTADPHFCASCGAPQSPPEVKASP